MGLPKCQYRMMPDLFRLLSIIRNRSKSSEGTRVSLVCKPFHRPPSRIWIVIVESTSEIVHFPFYSSMDYTLSPRLLRWRIGYFFSFHKSEAA